MNKRAIGILFVAALVSAGPTLGLGCADILGAKFDHTFTDAGLDDMDGGAVSAAAAGSSGAGGAGGASSVTGTGGAGGASGTAANCPADGNSIASQCRVHVFVRVGVPDGGLNSATLDALMTFQTTAPPEFNATPVSVFALSKHYSITDNVAVFSCEQADGTHRVSVNKACKPGKLLGYLAEDSQGAPPPDHVGLLYFSPNSASTGLDLNRALIAAKDEPTFCGIPPKFGMCSLSATHFGYE